MADMQTITTFLGWCTVVNSALLLLATLAMMMLKGMITGIHARLLDVNESDLGPLYFQYLANYKLAIIVLNLVPYIALRIMA